MLSWENKAFQQWQEKGQWSNKWGCFIVAFKSVLKSPPCYNVFFFSMLSFSYLPALPILLEDGYVCYIFILFKYILLIFCLACCLNITWNLISLNCLSIWRTSGEDGRSRAEQLLHILRQIDPYVSSPVECQRRRGCLAVHEMLVKFRMVCISGYCALGCHGICTHNRQIDRSMQGIGPKLPCKVYPSIIFQSYFFFLAVCLFLFSHFYSSSPFLFTKLIAAFMLPSREALCLGERVITYLPRCADSYSEVRKISAQVIIAGSFFWLLFFFLTFPRIWCNYISFVSAFYFFFSFFFPLFIYFFFIDLGSTLQHLSCTA